MDLQDQTLRIFDLELLEFAGIIMRLTLEHSRVAIGIEYEKGARERISLEEKLLQEARMVENTNEKEKEHARITNQAQDISLTDKTVEIETGEMALKGKAAKASSLFGFAKFMAKGVKKSIKTVVNNISDLVDETGGGAKAVT